MTDRASAEGLREAIDAALHELGEPGPGYPAPVANAVDILRAALRSSESDSGIDVERLRRAVFNIDHATPGVGWVEDVVAEYARLSTPRTETSE